MYTPGTQANWTEVAAMPQAQIQAQLSSEGLGGDSMDSDGGDSEIREVAACVDSPEGPVEQQETHAAAQKRARGQRGGQQAKLTPN